MGGLPWLTWLLDRLLDHKINLIDELVPWRFNPSPKSE